MEYQQDYRQTKLYKYANLINNAHTAYALLLIALFITSTVMIYRRVRKYPDSKEIMKLSRVIHRARLKGDYETFFKNSFRLISLMEKNASAEELKKYGKRYETIRDVLKADMIRSEKKGELVVTSYRDLFHVLKEDVDHERIVQTDGGREDAGFYKNKYKLFDLSRDCVIRGYAIASGEPYKKVHKELSDFQMLSVVFDRKYPQGIRPPTYVDSAGVSEDLLHAYMDKKGWHKYKPTRNLKRTRVKLFPKGNYVIWIRGHVFAIKDQKVYDNHKKYNLIRSRKIEGIWVKDRKKIRDLYDADMMKIRLRRDWLKLY